MRHIYKIPLILILLLLFILTSLSIYFLAGENRERIIIKNASFFSKITLFVLGIRSDFKGKYDKSKNYLIVSNHLSYIDILILLSNFPAIFVSTKEVEKSFLLGFVAKLGGAVFIDRKNFANLKNEIQMITNILKKGFNVVLFPEGTTSDGSCILDFKAPFLISAKLASKDVLPICIKYKLINDEPVCLENRDLVFYYGDMQFFPHVWKLLKLKNVYIEIKILKALNPTNLNRKEISTKLKDNIEKYYEPISN